MYRTVPLSIIRSFSLYTAMVYVIQQQDQDGTAVPSWSCSQAVAKLYDIYHCSVQWKTPDDGLRNCPIHVEFNSKNKFEKLVHLFGFIIQISNACFTTMPFLLNLYVPCMIQKFSLANQPYLHWNLNTIHTVSYMFRHFMSTMFTFQCM
jgi:hypothetical protein